MGKRIGVLWLIVLIDLVGFGLTAPAFPLVMERAGASAFWMTFAGAGVFSLFQLIFTPIWGRLSDAYGRRPILMISMIGAGICYLALATLDSYIMLIIARAFGGMMSGNISAAFAYVSDISEPKERAKFLGILASAFGLGFMLGPLIGGFLGTIEGGEVSLKWPAFAAAALSGLAFLGTLLLLKESLAPEHRKPLRSADGARSGQSPLAAMRTRPALLAIVLTTAILGTAGAMMQSIYPVWASATHRHDTKWIGIAFAVMAALAVVSQAGFVGLLAKRVGERGVAGLGILGMAVGLAVITFLHSPWGLWAGLVTAGLGLGLTNPALSALASFQATPQERGAVMGAFQSGSSLGRVLGPALSGPLYAGVSHGAPFMVATALGVLALFVIVRVPEPTQGARTARAA